MPRTTTSAKVPDLGARSVPVDIQRLALASLFHEAQRARNGTFLNVQEINASW